MAKHTRPRPAAMPIKAQAAIVAQLREAESYQLCSEATIKEAIRVINIPVAYRTPADSALIRELSRILHTLHAVKLCNKR